MEDSSLGLDNSNAHSEHNMVKLPRHVLKKLLPPVPLIPKNYFHKEPLKTGKTEKLL